MRSGAAPLRTSGRGDALAPLAALALANARYWPSVAPTVRGEIALAMRLAERIADPTLRALAIGKLTDEHFNAEVAATLATLASRRERRATARAIVALELLFDYLDGRTELPSDDPLAESARQFAAFTVVFDPDPPPQTRPRELAAYASEDADGAYTRALSDRARENLFALPGAHAVADVARDSAELCAQAQSHLHAAAILGDGQLREWAEDQASTSGLGWREYVVGLASAVLSGHALIAAAADPATSGADARRIDAAYVAIGGVVTMLDSIVDRAADRARGEPGVIRLFTTPEEIEHAMRTLTREALARAREAPHSAHHTMTLAGGVAYYATHPGAREPHARAIMAMLRRELPPAIWPGLAVMGGWRVAKRVHASRVGAGDEPRPILGS